MPHALFVHSWFTKNKTERKSIEEKRRMLKLHLVENVVLLTIAGLVNAAIMLMAAAAFHPKYSSMFQKNKRRESKYQLEEKKKKICG
jgi:manganese transport protein